MPTLFSKRFIFSQAVFLAAMGLLFYLGVTPDKKPSLPIYGTVGDFHLDDQNEHGVGLATFKDKVWVVNFMFTTCSGICPMMTANMATIHQSFLKYDNVRMVSISVNPENDSPEVLRVFAKKYKANSDQWLFLTGDRADIQKLAAENFKIGDTKEIVFHSPLFVLVDSKNKIRGYYDGTDKERIKQLYKDLHRLIGFKMPPLNPTINASLNALAGIFLLLGFAAIRRKDRISHRKYMMAAFVSSALFLCAYVYYHATTHVLTKYQGQGIMRGIYFFVLGTHTPLAVIIVPFIIIAIRHALKGNFEQHKRITRWLYPTWLYVTVTGVLIYLMLYILPN